MFRASLGDGAVVVLKIGAYDTEQQLARIRREVSLLSRLNRPEFPKCSSFDLLPGQRFLIVEEFVPGLTLAESFHAFTSEESALELLFRLADGLSAIWVDGVVHRDLKPANIIIRENKSPVILDLGIARVLGEESLTQTFFAIGPCTPAYASPEQLRNQKELINHRTDQFLLGMLGAQLLLSGVHPFHPSLVGGGDIPSNILNDRWAREFLEEKAPDSYRLFDKMLSHQPYNRYRKYDQLLNEIGETWRGTYDKDNSPAGA